MWLWFLRKKLDPERILHENDIKGPKERSKGEIIPAFNRML